MMNPSLFQIILCLFILFSSCKKEIETQDNAGCLRPYLSSALPIDDPNFDCCNNCGTDVQEINSAVIPFDYRYPAFNPENSNQMVYYRGDNTQNIFKGFEIWFYDFCTQTSQLLVKDAFYGLEWGHDDWIFYTATDQNIYKIKRNGENLTQVTFAPPDSYNRDPKNSPSGTKLLYQAEISGITRLLIQDFATGEMDTLQTTPAIQTWCWIDESRIFYTIWIQDGVLALCVFDLNTRQETRIQKLLVGTSIASKIVNAQYLKKDNSIIWCAYKTVGKTNIDTRESQILLKALTPEVYQGLTLFGSDGDFVLNKLIVNVVDSCHIDSEYDFYLISGSRYEKIKW